MTERVDTMLTYKDNYLPVGHRNRPGGYMKAAGILFHTTNNWADGAGDEMHGEYMKNQMERVVSWHDTVDKDSVTHSLPYTEHGWHAGDGYGKYNMTWIGIEIACEAVAPGQPLDKATYDNAVEHISNLMNKFKFGWDQLQPHNIVKGKDCPHHDLFDREQFKRDVIKKMGKFSDVSGHWADDNIKVISDLGIMSGYPDGSFKPDQPVTRAELVVVVLNTLKEVDKRYGKKEV